MPRTYEYIVIVLPADGEDLRSGTCISAQVNAAGRIEAVNKVIAGRRQSFIGRTALVYQGGLTSVYTIQEPVPNPSIIIEEVR